MSVETFRQFMATLTDRIFDLVSAPVQNPEMLWIVAPLVTTLILMEFYFGRYKDEELGYNSSVANSLVLLFVSLDLVRYLYSTVGARAFTDILNLPSKTIIALIVAAQAIALFYISYYHILPRRLSFVLTNTTVINLTAYVAAVIIYTNIPVDIFTLLAAVLVYIALYFAFRGARKVEDEVIPLPEARPNVRK